MLFFSNVHISNMHIWRRFAVFFSVSLLSQFENLKPELSNENPQWPTSIEGSLSSSAIHHFFDCSTICQFVRLIDLFRAQLIAIRLVIELDNQA